MPQKHQSTKTHKTENINKLFLVKFCGLVIWWLKLNFRIELNLCMII